MTEIPTISDKQNLSFAESKREYRQLEKLLAAKTFPQGGTGWSSSISNKINDRLAYLQKRISDFVIGDQK